MKKTMILALAAAVIALPACKKSYTCTCTTTGTISQSGFSIPIAGSSTSAYSAKMTKKQADAACQHEGETNKSVFEDELRQSNDPKDPYNYTVQSVCTVK